MPDLLIFSLPFGITVDVISIVEPLGRYRSLMVAILYLGVMVSMVGLLLRLLGLGGGIREVMSTADQNKEGSN